MGSPFLRTSTREDPQKSACQRRVVCKRPPEPLQEPGEWQHGWWYGSSSVLNAQFRKNSMLSCLRMLAFAKARESPLAMNAGGRGCCHNLLRGVGCVTRRPVAAFNPEPKNPKLIATLNPQSQTLKPETSEEEEVGKGGNPAVWNNGWSSGKQSGRGEPISTCQSASVGPLSSQRNVVYTQVSGFHPPCATLICGPDRISLLRCTLQNHQDDRCFCVFSPDILQKCLQRRRLFGVKWFHTSCFPLFDSPKHQDCQPQPNE